MVTQPDQPPKILFMFETAEPSGSSREPRTPWLSILFLSGLGLAVILFGVVAPLVYSSATQHCASSPSTSALEVLAVGQEGTKIDGQLTLFPFGVSCRYEAEGVVVIEEPSWITTIAVAICSAAFVRAGIALTNSAIRKRSFR
jgi:hypothetical protein